MSNDEPAVGAQEQHRCADCGTPAPPTDTNYTLISARHGWRLSLSKGPDGRREAIWRCPSCWAVFRGRR